MVLSVARDSEIPHRIVWTFSDLGKAGIWSLYPLGPMEKFQIQTIITDTLGLFGVWERSSITSGRLK